MIATDEAGFGNTVESQFNLQLRDFCADGELSVNSDLASFTYTMGVTASTRKTLDLE